MTGHTLLLGTLIVACLISVGLVLIYFDDALNCFAFGLSDSCRLKVKMRGDFPHRWTVESREGDTWIEDSTTGLFFFPFWRRPKITYKQNNLAPKKEKGVKFGNR